jgi:hypothetical protein
VTPSESVWNVLHFLAPVDPLYHNLWSVSTIHFSDGSKTHRLVLCLLDGLYEACEKDDQRHDTMRVQLMPTPQP